jgi:multiple sugar transport system substrate-binding protein
MPNVVLRGITWAHRRAIDPLIGVQPRFRRHHPDIEVTWETRSLSGFEFDPIARLAEQFDLIVLDHPFVGDIAASGCLLPLEQAVEGLSTDTFVGPSLEAYRYAGHIWAVPVDAAAQVALYRPDVLAALDAAVPQTWEEALVLGQRALTVGHWLAVAFAGVHGLMTFFSLCANLGRACACEPGAPFVDRAVAREALHAMRRLRESCPPQALEWNSIDVHEAMVARNDIAYCPAVYGYATYGEADVPRRLQFADFPGLGRRSVAGSTLGGTGVGVSAHTAHCAAALAYAGFLGERETQLTFAAFHGQPARMDAWNDSDIDKRFGGFFSGTRATLEGAWIRPRYARYIEFQEAGGRLVEAHLRNELGEARLLSELEALHAGRGPRGNRT